MTTLPYSFYNRKSTVVAKELLGKIISRELDSQDENSSTHFLSGRIIETEAYEAEQDEASHSFKGKTKQNRSLYLDAGHLYIYSIHSHSCMDIVTGDINLPTSVLVRAIYPLEGIELMKKNRNKERLKDLCSGPGKLMQALNLNKDVDGLNILGEQSYIKIYDDGYIAQEVFQTTRVGISKAKEKLNRFYLNEFKEYVSRK